MDQGNPRLNMKHGFIHHIRRNQMKRDEYDKEMRGRTENKKDEKVTYPDQEVYRPKRMGTPKRNNTSENTDTRKAGVGKLLFILEYCDNGGWVHKIEIRNDDDPRLVAKRLAKEAKVPDELLETLEWKIEQDIMKRDTAVK